MSIKYNIKYTLYSYIGTYPKGILHLSLVICLPINTPMTSYFFFVLIFVTHIVYFFHSINRILKNYK